MGVVLEFSQLLTDGRSFEPEDILANCIGLLAGLAVGFVLRFWVRRDRNASRRFRHKSEIPGISERA